MEDAQEIRVKTIIGQLKGLCWELQDIESCYLSSYATEIFDIGFKISSLSEDLERKNKEQK